MLEINNVSKIYGEGHSQVVALQGVSLKVTQGDFIAIMGPSGSGKSTLLNIIGCLDNLSEGQVVFDGQRIDILNENELVSVRRGRIAYIFQQFHLIPSLNALENVLLPIMFSGIKKNGAGQQAAMDMLRRVGLENRATHKPSELSGGEQQRIAIARALVSNPMLILADEPTGNLDQKTGKQILGLLEELNNDGHTIVMVTHDLEIAKHASQIIVLEDGSIVNRMSSQAEKEQTEE
ncbi:MAG: ABC transporter ATP-binding protein [Chloroflexi bacterium]|jgi:putative ABC transport system ATP-binding protein|nr:ABC transporter ATP-binding protein [Chloroflexota bacterium]MBT7081996.1 ABC transporter ATP-binding protein [Chloroflexota bacterium]